jgi:type III secretion protein HrpB1
LRSLGDPSWHSIAVAHEDDPDPYIRKAMRQLLERPPEADLGGPCHASA